MAINANLPVSMQQILDLANNHHQAFIYVDKNYYPIFYNDEYHNSLGNLISKSKHCELKKKLNGFLDPKMLSMFFKHLEQACLGQTKMFSMKTTCNSVEESTTIFMIPCLSGDKTEGVAITFWKNEPSSKPFLKLQELSEQFKSFTYFTHAALLKCPYGVVFLDENLHINFANDAACHILNYDRSTLLTQTLRDIDIPHSEEGINLQHLKNNTVHHFHKKNKGQVTVAVKFVNLDFENTPCFCLFFTELEEKLFDIITELPSRTAFQHDLLRSIETVQEQHPLTLLTISINKLKWVNYTLNHKAGDKVIREACKRIKKCAHPFDMMARLSGEEFALLYEGNMNLSLIETKANCIIEALAKPFYVAHTEVNISSNIGIAQYPNNAKTAKELLQCSMSAKHQAEKQSKNCYQFFNHKNHSQTIQKLKIENELIHAQPGNQIAIYYQPIINIQTNAVYGAEALILWHHPQLGDIPPDKFIPHAEETGIIQQIGRWVFSQSCKQMSQWNRQLNRNMKISINTSGVQLSDRLFLNLVAHVEKETHLSANNVVLEITESVLPNYQGHVDVLKCLQKLKFDGIQISLDDFGTGFSSLSYLRQLPVDLIKIDISFIQDITWDSQARAIVHTIIAMAKSLNLKTIAEGVEDLNQLNILKSLGCDLIQGYYFSHPLSAEQFLEYIQPSPSILTH